MDHFQSFSEGKYHNCALCIMHFYVLSGKYQIFNNPHRCAEPPVREHEGLFRDDIGCVGVAYHVLVADGVPVPFPTEDGQGVVVFRLR